MEGETGSEGGVSGPGADRGSGAGGSDCDVVVVGGGPTGLMVANVLAADGVEVLVVERRPGPVSEPRAVSIDDEAMRALQRAGLASEARRVTVPGTGTRYVGARGQELAYARGPVVKRLGYPVKNPIDQPSFERLLIDGLGHHGSARLEMGASVEGFAKRGEGTDSKGADAAGGAGAGGRGFSVEIRDAGGEVRIVGCRYLLGCDGGRSMVRQSIGVAMAGSSIAEPWIVVDTVNDPHDERYAIHHGDPRRPHVIVPVGEGRCRYEFMLLPGEDPEAAVEPDFVRELLRPYHHPLPNEDIRRRTVYVFHALVAGSWSRGGAFLLGDAAHMMPPFAGQGLNSGLRDALNLGWKLSAVTRGVAGEGLLASYERERRPNVEATIRLSTRMGGVMMTRSRAKAWLRDRAVAALNLTPKGRRYFAELRFKPVPEVGTGFVVAPADERIPIGEMLPQPWVVIEGGATELLDEVLGPGFALIAVDAEDDPFPMLRHALWSRLEAERVSLRLGDRLPPAGLDHPAIADRDGELARFFDRCRGRIALIRPDRFLAGVFAPCDEAAFAGRLEEALGEAGDSA